MAESKNIYAAMSAIMCDTSAIGKARRNEKQGFMFRGIDDVYNALHPIFAKHGVVILPEVLAHRIEERRTAKGDTAYAHISKIMFHFVASDGSEVTATTIGEAADRGDKGASKAASIALKYAIFQIFLIPTENAEDDADASSWEFAQTFTAEQAASAKQWCDALDPRVFEDTLAHLGVERLEDLAYSRKKELMDKAKAYAAELKKMDERNAEKEGGNGGA